METIRRRRKNPKTLTLVERRLVIPRPGTMRRKIDVNAQRQNLGPSRPNKRSQEKSAESDGELLTQANRFGGNYQPLDHRLVEEDEQQQLEINGENEPESECESQIIRGDNLPIVF